jgi:predicted RNA binding protein YcfA (HicA-like mRNA interferase family)
VASLPNISGQEARAAFQKAGWNFARQRGSHMIMIKSGSIASLSVPDHKELAKGTLRSLIRAAEMSTDEFVELLKSR